MENKMQQQNKIWCVVPAAGVGSRMQSDIPKQYIDLRGKPILEHTLEHLLKVDLIEELVLVVAVEDDRWQGLPATENERIMLAHGGEERFNSVLNGLHALAAMASDDDWVLVHDVARPLVRKDDVEKLIQACTEKNCGGILAIPVSDTLKKSDENNLVYSTVDRNNVWSALTPQLFHFGKLKTALENCIGQKLEITDEASAIEFAGEEVILVQGSRLNIKITEPEDLLLAEAILEKESGSGS